VVDKFLRGRTGVRDWYCQQDVDDDQSAEASPYSIAACIIPPGEGMPFFLELALMDVRDGAAPQLVHVMTFG